MKLPEQLSGAMRRHHQRRMDQTASPAKGIVPQDAWCEDTCDDTYDEGSEEHQECFESCWDD